ncbi:hypothetical protein [Phyllobacterium bourgognense]|uniref:Uncharacterized protein n=1 Tax=Phyllobacterium bourgognense TaxID=314236 RepID=A0A368YKH4_9HYPH|nr:hypothetical protein [Phyllobacterium bourgognense]RCW80119.1 hypothetical protein C7476_11584 [Phyllobacterium bourgognense]
MPLGAAGRRGLPPLASRFAVLDPYFAKELAPGWIFPAGSFSTSIIGFQLDKAFDFETTTPIGSFSPAFLKAIASTVKQAAAARKLAGVALS